MSLKIGALVPVSRLFPGADRTFVAGLRGALADAGLDHELVIEGAANCAVRDQVASTLQRMLLQHSPDIVTSIMGAGISRHMHPFFLDAATPFIVNDLGADPWMPGDAGNTFVFCNTLNIWQSMYALGFWAAAHLGPRAVVAAGFHEAGYGMVQAFWLGFAGAGGGTVLATEVTHRTSADDDPSEQIRGLAAKSPDFIIAFYSGREGASFMNALDALGLASTFPVLTTPLATHAHWWGGMTSLPSRLHTAFSWDMSGEVEEHERFRRLAKIAGASEPAVFALLGYETGRLIAAAARDGADAASIAEALAAVRVRSPRGEVGFDPVMRETATVDHLQELRREPDGRAGRQTLGPLPLPASFRADYDAIRLAEGRSGWFNPYLIT